MRNIQVYDKPGHRFVLLNESEPGEEDGIRSNQFLIMHGDAGVLQDPDGFGVMPRVLAEMLRYLPPVQVHGIVLSHQHPDIVGGLSTWMEVTRCPINVSAIWMRFLPHYGFKEMSRFVGVPDQGLPQLAVAPGFNLQILPAHFLHSEGQINVYDAASSILFSGDMGAAMLPLDKNYIYVDDFQSHVPFIAWFHRRYMGSNKAIRIWLRDLTCGTDIMQAGGYFPGEPA
ncbi:MBL fold metallo-hydrolase [Candidatus Methylospira mobilis]|uniref:MBL fold metallo-hydrolase n=1 Tax=Candidatus Methylospira mobilis TaxID=1808979 RepID=A0A5Q0BFF1_9GAMM|nr:MBL fold metallo-hydrolase [Candidatus Methylospira mobilis]QFY42550.1 MBL fold metallo-hydrolase [Candidatus Methylospira mobilis]